MPGGLQQEDLGRSFIGAEASAYHWCSKMTRSEGRKGAWPNTFYGAFSGRKCFLIGHPSRIQEAMFKTSA